MNPHRIRIERLVLDGVAPADAFRVAQALVQELAPLVRRHGPPDEARLVIKVRGGLAPDALGQSVARQLYTGERG